jgi:hypothetical protein
MFGFQRGHPLLRRVIDGIVAKYHFYKARVLADPKTEIIRFTGPEHFTECIHDFARTRGMSGIQQVGVDFDGRSIIEMPGSYVRYCQQPCYELARNEAIVS